MPGKGNEGSIPSRTNLAPLAAEAHGRNWAVAALHGGVLGAWWFLCLLGFSHGARRAWGLVTLDAGAGYQLFPIDRIAVEIANSFGLSFIGSLNSLGLFLLLLGLLSGYMVAAAGQSMRLDPQRLSRRAILNAPCQIGNTLAWMGPFVLFYLASTFIYMDRQPSWLLPACLMTGLLLVALTPFLVLNRATLKDARRSRWRVTWPGWSVLGTAAAVWIVFAAFDGLAQLAFIPGGYVAWIILLPFRWLVDAASSAIFCATWIDRQGMRELWRRRRSVFGCSRLGPFLALKIRLAVLWLWILPLILGLLFNLLYIFPQIVRLAEENGETLPLWFRWILAWREDLLFPLLVLGPLMLFVNGRLHVLLTPSEPDDSGTECDSNRTTNIPPPPFHAPFSG